MKFTGKQKAKIKILANKHKIMFQIGQNGLTKNVINNIFDYLRKHEVGRISVLKSSIQTKEEISVELEKLGINVVDSIGKVLLMYRENPKLKKKINL